jgi:hypothetical protein
MTHRRRSLTLTSFEQFTFGDFTKDADARLDLIVLGERIRQTQVVSPVRIVEEAGRTG